ncbi:MAG: phosphate ABC transporter permease PstA [Desulfotomaculales bacterium]
MLVRRRLTNLIMTALCVVLTACALVPLASILAFVAVHGFKVLSPEFLTRLPAALGEPGGGIGNAIVGSVIVVGCAALLAVPVGVLAGVYLAEFGRGTLAAQVRFWSEVLVGVPSIIVGAAVYGLLVVPMGRFSALAGSVALAIIMVPVVTRVTEEMVRMVPATLREASLALGATRARTVISVVLRSARAGILTGTMLAVARAAGETAPLLFTALSSRYWFSGLDQRVASLPVYIFTYATTPYEELHRQAWGAALVLLALVLALNVAARATTRRIRL